MVSGALLSFEDCFQVVDDPRVLPRCTHSLHTILFVAVAATIAGADGPEDMEKFADRKRSWLEQFVDLTGGVPSHDTIGRVLGLIKPRQFQDAFLRWISSLSSLQDQEGNPIFIPIDGKTMRGSYKNADKSDMLHIVSAWASRQGITLGQIAVDSKSNEITAIPKLLEMLELNGAIVSIDAMGCQREIASRIVAGGGDYVLMVKGNQPKLEKAIEDAFGEEVEATKTKARRRVTEEKSRGRQETRHYTIMPLPDSMSEFGKKWTGLRSIGRVVREVQRDGKQTSETSYYIASLESKVDLFSDSVRSHWGIENSLHWVMDVVFGEDRSRIREGHAAENMSFLRRFVTTLLKQDTSKSSLKQKRKEAAWDTKFLEKLLFE
ncbi:MAG: ISAs1 family transposase [Planctomycetes bacterium]|nr:ISAs1 family transposase [Planctomycetota bacterium]